jgi:transcriptional regulatory protein LevR
MTAFEPPAYAELRQLFGAYLNADVADDYGSVGAAIDAYRRETGAAHRHAALVELVHLRATTSSHAAFADALTGLGCEIAFDHPMDAHRLAETLVEALREVEESGG